jgi:hypothetical protein
MLHRVNAGKPERGKESLLLMIADSKTVLIIIGTKNRIQIFVQETKTAQNSSVTWGPNKMMCIIVLLADMRLLKSEQFNLTLEYNIFRCQNN